MAFQLDGSKIQLASNGSSWIHENADTNPFLPAPYKQYSHFGKEDIQLSKKGDVDIGLTTEFILDTEADILLNLFLKIGITVIESSPWRAEKIIDTVRIFSGETELDFYNYAYQRVHYNFMLNQDKKSLWDKMTSSIYDNGRPTELYLPLLFGFCQNDDQTLPHVAMINKNIRIEIKWDDSLNNVNKENVTLWGNVAYLQGTELNRVKFTNEYLLLKTLDNETNDLETGITQLKQNIYMKRLVRDLTWFMTDDKSYGFGFNWPTGGPGYPNQLMNPVTIHAHAQPHQSSGVVRLTNSLPAAPTVTVDMNISRGKMETGEFLLDKKSLFPVQKEKFFNLLQAYWRYPGCPQPGYYTYSWALDPTSTQPSGTLNSSLFEEIQLDMDLYAATADDPLISWFSSMSTIMKKANGTLMPISKE